jgi:xanthine dehydrogenase iron-sulfur cluster and FAD-binding subunit A
MWHTYFAPSSVAEALELLERYGDRCRLIAGGTDLILELERGVRKQQIIVDISRIAGLDRIDVRSPDVPGTSESAGHVTQLSLGATVTHNQLVASRDTVAQAFPLARACWLVGAPQIRNRGTVAGNLITASPANDTITPLWAMDAMVTLASRARGERTLPCDQFFLGVRRTALLPDEMLVRINVPALKPTERGTFLKLGLRQAQAISVVNVAVIVDFGLPISDSGSEAGDELPIRNPAPLRFGDYSPQSAIRNARIALGSVAPTIVRAAEAEAYLAGKELTDEVIERAVELAASAARPISDIRGSADYRRDMVRVLVARALRQLRDGTERADWPEQPVLLWGRRTGERENGRMGDHPLAHSPIPPLSDTVNLTLNGKPTVLHGVRGKTLLRALREDAGLTGTKEGCAEGECGACTVWLDGVAVMSCLVPAERADGCEVVTVEGLAGLYAPAGRPVSEIDKTPQGLTIAPEGASQLQTAGLEPPGALHPLQQAFIDAGAVQCGYCTPGILMSAANLLEEFPQPTGEQVKQALTGNLCRCTGYYKILEAIERATINEVQP